ncbi:hypothetical protein GOODEAATRI_023997 [Goodea atripinnis]|uniref:Uncharacterized protein n=1 Tax=Goodea atripinnis TaxID=208336 RepID=A0ABV0N3V1_9TELE
MTYYWLRHRGTCALTSSRRAGLFPSMLKLTDKQRFLSITRPSSYRLPPHLRPGSDRTRADWSESSNGDRIWYGIMFDAGSTGTRCSVGIMELLDVAKSSVPPSMWTRTPVVLKATAGLRLLPGEKADQLLDKVRLSPVGSD